MHRVDLARATGRPFVLGDHDRQIVAPVVGDLARGWSSVPVPVALELTGPAGGGWLLGSGDPVAVVRAEAVAYMRALAGRDERWRWSWSLGRRPRSPHPPGPSRLLIAGGLCLGLLQGVEADQHACQLHQPQQDVGAPLVAHLQAPVAHQPRQRPLQSMSGHSEIRMN